MRRALWHLAALPVALALAGTSVASAQAESASPLRFVAHTIDTGLTGGYQAVVADLNRDGRPDIIAVTLGLEELAWYENPGWEKHILVSGLERMINLAAHDIDGDGIPELALAHGFATSHERSPGIVSLLTHRGDPTAQWSIEEIDRVPTAHRLRWADPEGSGTRVLINAPLLGPAAATPDYRDRLSLFWYRPSDWQRRVLTTEEEGVVHGIFVASRGDEAGGDEVLSASFLGIHSHRFDTGRWVRTRLTAGDPAPWPASGSSDVAVGELGGQRFLAAIEPWHGNQVVIYRGQGASWQRTVIDTTIEDGHTIVVGDLDGDGRDEVVVGERRGKRSVYVYATDGAAAESWSRQTIDDGGMAAAGCAIEDLNADGRRDVVCIGTSTANLKWYESRAQ